MILQLPVKTHVYKFLLHKYPQQPFILNEKDYINTFTYSILRRQHDYARYSKFLSKYTQNFSIDIKDQILWKHGCRNVTSFTIVKFNGMIEGIMKDLFRQYVDTLSEYSNIKESIYNWMAIYNLEDGDGFNYQTLKQDYVRYRKAKEAA